MTFKSNKENDYDDCQICEMSSVFEKETNLEYHTNLRIIQSSDQVIYLLFLQTTFINISIDLLYTRCVRPTACS